MEDAAMHIARHSLWAALWFWGFAAALIAVFAIASGTLDAATVSKAVALGAYFDYFEDRCACKTIEQMAAGSMAFVPAKPVTWHCDIHGRRYGSDSRYATRGLNLCIDGWSCCRLT